MTLSDLEWPFHASRAISAIAEVLKYLCLTSDGRLYIGLRPIYAGYSSLFERTLVICIYSIIS